MDWFLYDNGLHHERVHGFVSDLSHIFIILMQISSWPWALYMFKALVILGISSSFKSKELNGD